jgi:hypothetical protein
MSLSQLNSITLTTSQKACLTVTPVCQSMTLTWTTPTPTLLYVVGTNSGAVIYTTGVLGSGYVQANDPLGNVVYALSVTIT